MQPPKKKIRKQSPGKAVARKAPGANTRHATDGSAQKAPATSRASQPRNGKASSPAPGEAGASDLSATSSGAARTRARQQKPSRRELVAGAAAAGVEGYTPSADAAAEKAPAAAERGERPGSAVASLPPPISDLLPRIALVGRPNVGKSTLFNRLIRSKRAITHDMPGITRDRMEGLVRSSGEQSYVLIDTGGITLDSHAAVAEGPAGLRGFETEILRQVEEAITGSAVLCLVVDGREGLTPFDEHVAAFVRKAGKPALVAVNKVDGPERSDAMMAEFYSLGLPMLPCSAEHGFNTRTLEHELCLLLPDADTPEGGEDSDADGIYEDDATKAPLRLALLGRPNAGKSSLVNALTGLERMIVSDLAGTTRDSVDVSVTIDGTVYTFVDTAGVRRPAKVTETVERYSVNSSLKSTSKAHVTLLVVDGLAGVTQQDKRLVELLSERMTPFIILVNKSDLMTKEERTRLEKEYKSILEFCPHVPMLFVSALGGYNLQKILPMAERLRAECYRRIGTGVLNRASERILARHQPPLVKGGRAKFYYMTQAEIAPPTFVFFVNDEARVLPSYIKYIEKSLRKELNLLHAPLRVRFRSTHVKKTKK